MKTIDAPATYGATVKITGDEVGPFLIHEYALGDVVEQMWRVTLTKTGSRFPWSFCTKEAAEAFAKEASAVMDWKAVKNGRPSDNTAVANWTAGKPTKEQSKTIRNLALARGGIRA